MALNPGYSRSESFTIITKHEQIYACENHKKNKTIIREYDRMARGGAMGGLEPLYMVM